jgi:ribosomal protein S12 methylthiotransferase
MATHKQKIHLLTLGCSKNTVDSEELMRQFESNNWELSETSSGADIAVINTCGFIEDAKHESIQTILQAVELKRSGEIRKIVVMGCLSERYATELRKEIPEVDAFIGANKMDQVVRWLGGNYRTELLGERHLTTPSHFAYLKISEGCDNPCSFCAIPLMRGKHVSKSLERVELEARRLAALGVKELVVIAQDSTYYGLDLYGKRTLADLFRRLDAVGGIEWIRLMYAFPAKFPEDVLDVLASGRNICRYIDMPVQHVSDRVLKSMQRGISSRALRSLIDRIREKVPGIALRTTLIVGYPNEGEKEFNELVQFVREVRFDRLGVFTYSQEDDTSAHPLGDPVPAEVKQERQSIIMELQKQISLERNESLVGRTERVIIDQKEGVMAFGRTSADAPEIDNEVTIHDAGGLSIGEMYDVEIVDAGEYDLFARPKALLSPDGSIPDILPDRRTA